MLGQGTIGTERSGAAVVAELSSSDAPTVSEFTAGYQEHGRSICWWFIDPLLKL